MKTGALAIALAVACGVSIYAEDAKSTWDKQCAKCHGPDGKGETKLGRKMGVKDLTAPTTQEKFTDEQAFKAIKEGLKEGDKVKMKPAEGLSDEEIKALIAHVRSLKK